MTSWPSLAKALGRLLATSAKPPVLEKGATSATTETILSCLAGIRVAGANGDGQSVGRVIGLGQVFKI